MTKRPLGLLIALLALVPAACGGSSSPSGGQPVGGASTSGGGSGGGSASTITTKNVSGLGVVLVNGAGRTLYTFAPDKATKVTCTGSCAQVWPPLKVSGKPTVSAPLKQSLVSTAPNPSGGSVATYNGWPLYTYVSDASPGTAHGQALNNSGGLWYVISPSGQVIKKKGGAAASTGSDGY